jgi:hypothetical protein
MSGYTNPTQITALATAVVQAAKEQKKAQVLIQQALVNNDINDPNWADLANVVPDAVDENGNVVGTIWKPSDISACIESLQQFQNTYTGAAPVHKTAWGENIEKVVDPIV